MKNNEEENAHRVYKKAFDLTVNLEKVVAGFSRYHKYTLGAELRNCGREVVLLIFVIVSFTIFWLTILKPSMNQSSFMIPMPVARVKGFIAELPV